MSAFPFRQMAVDRARHLTRESQIPWLVWFNPDARTWDVAMATAYDCADRQGYRFVVFTPNEEAEKAAMRAKQRRWRRRRAD